MKGKTLGIGLLFFGINLIVQYSGLFFYALFESAGVLQEIFGKYLYFYIYSTEYLLISLSPLVLMAVLLKYPPKNKRTIWQYYTWQLLLSYFSFFLGLMVGLLFWKPPNDLLPDEGVVQPFAYYWTMVIYPATLILCSVYVYHWHKHTTRNEINAIGSKES